MSAATPFVLLSPRLAHFPGRVGVQVVGSTRAETSGSMVAGVWIQAERMATAPSTTYGYTLQTRPWANPARGPGSRARTQGPPTAFTAMRYAHIRRTRYGLRVAAAMRRTGSTAMANSGSSAVWATIPRVQPGTAISTTCGDTCLIRIDLRNEGVIALCVTGDSSNALTLTGCRQLIRSSIGVVSDP